MLVNRKIKVGGMVNQKEKYIENIMFWNTFLPIMYALIRYKFHKQIAKVCLFYSIVWFIILFRSERLRLWTFAYRKAFVVITRCFATRIHALGRHGLQGDQRVSCDWITYPLQKARRRWSFSGSVRTFARK